MANRKLYVVTMVSNPIRFASRYKLFAEFKERVEKETGAEFFFTEVAFGDRPFSFAERNNYNHIQVRTFFELWHKENCLNLAIQQLPDDWEYVAWIDADVMFTRADWVQETIEQLQHYMVVQMFSHATDLTSRYEPIRTQTGFVYDWYHNPESVERGGYATFSHPGYAWAARREALDAVGGLIDFAILGSADRHMACALIGKADYSFHADVTQAYKDAVLAWEDRAVTNLKMDVGYVSGTLLHHYHGPKAKRGYNDRWKILVDNKFDPCKDIFRDSQGLWQLSDKAIKLRDGIRRYFRSRDEDNLYAEGNEKILP